MGNSRAPQLMEELEAQQRAWWGKGQGEGD